jgi:hypothetical protein
VFGSMVRVVSACLEKSIVSIYLGPEVTFDMLLGTQNEHKCARGCLRERTVDQSRFRKLGWKINK